MSDLVIDLQRVREEREGGEFLSKSHGVDIELGKLVHQVRTLFSFPPGDNRHQDPYYPGPVLTTPSKLPHPLGLLLWLLY
jgi:hypothetical protein